MMSTLLARGLPSSFWTFSTMSCWLALRVTLSVLAYSDGLGELKDSEFITVTDVDGSSLGTVHEQDQTIDQIVDVLERSSLGTITVNSHVFTLESLDDKVGNDSSVVWVHSWTESVENSSNSNINTILPHVTVSQGLGDSLSLVVTCSGTDTVDVTPVFFSLRVLLWVTVDFRGGGDEESSLCSLGKTEHVEGTHERGLDGLDSVVLVVRRGSGACKMVDFWTSAAILLEVPSKLTVNLDQEWLNDIVSDHLEVGVTDPVGDLKLVSFKTYG